ncbi:hypothetical protein Tco_0879978 [Tanacetum coccineum]
METPSQHQILGDLLCHSYRNLEDLRTYCMFSLADVLEYFYINLSQLSVIAAAKNDSFFWVDASVFPLSIPWHTKKTLTWDPSPTATEFSAEACDFLATHQALFRKFPEPFLCLVGISRYYDLDGNVYPTFLTATGEEIYLFSFIRHADPTKVWIGERQIEEGQVPLFESTEGRLIPLAGGNEQGNQNDNVEDIGPHDLNEESGDAEQENHSEGGDHDGQDEMITISIDEEVQVVAADKPKGTRKKRKVTVGLLERSTLALEISVTVAATVPFVTSSMTLTLEREGGRRMDSDSGPNLRSQQPAERFVISSDSSHHSSTNVADARVTSIVMSPISQPPVMTAAVATTAVAGTSFAPILGVGPELVHASIFADSASPSAVGSDTAGPSNPCGTKISADTFYVSQEMDSETLQQIYVPKWNVTNDSTLDDPEVCRSMIDWLAPPSFFSQHRGMDYDQLFAEFNVEAARQTCLSAKVKDDEIASLKSQLSLKEAEAIQAIRLCSQVSVKGELNSLRERNTALEAEKSVLEGQVAALESAIVIKYTELASFNTQITKLTQDLSNFQLSCHELSIKSTSLESERDRLIDQDAHVKVLSDRVATLDSNLTGMAVHLDEEFYPRFLTTIAGRRRVIEHGLRLAVMKCLQSTEYVTTLGTALGLAIDKGMKTGLVAGIDHGKAEWSLADVAAYDPSMEAKYVSAVLVIYDLDFNLLSLLESQKDASIADIMSLLHLEGPSAKTSKGVLTTVVATTTLVVADVNSVAPISVTDYGVLDAEPKLEESHSPKVVFEKEELDTIPDHPLAS